MYQTDTGRAIEYNVTAQLWMETLIAYQAKVAQVRLCPVAAPELRLHPILPQARSCRLEVERKQQFDRQLLH